MARSTGRWTGGNERGDARADTPAEGPEPFFMDMPCFATFRGQQLVVHGYEIIQRFCQLSRHLGFFRLAMYIHPSERRG